MSELTHVLKNSIWMVCIELRQPIYKIKYRNFKKTSLVIWKSHFRINFHKLIKCDKKVHYLPLFGFEVIWTSNWGSISNLSKIYD